MFEKSPGGSVILRHKHLSAPEIALADASTASFRQVREAAYEELFGPQASVFHETVPFLPHIDVYTFEPGHHGRNYYTLATGGMSDLPMRIPSNVSGAPRRVELVFYCSEPKAEYLETLRRIARFPHDQKTWLSYTHTMPNGNPPGPMWGSRVLDTFLFMPSIVNRDRNLPEELTLGEDQVHFLWVVPLTTRECEVKLKKGYNSLLSLFEQHSHPHVFDPNRRSYA